MAEQIFQQLKERGFQGRYIIIKDFVRQVRPKPRPAFLTLHFGPGECAQVDWVCAGSVPVGSTQRRLSFSSWVGVGNAAEATFRHRTESGVPNHFEQELRELTAINAPQDSFKSVFNRWLEVKLLMLLERSNDLEEADSFSRIWRLISAPMTR